MRLCCFAAEPSRTSIVETDYGDLLASGNVTTENKEVEVVQQQCSSNTAPEAVEAQIVVEQQQETVTAGKGVDPGNTPNSDDAEAASEAIVLTDTRAQDTSTTESASVEQHASRQPAAGEQQTPLWSSAPQVELPAASMGKRTTHNASVTHGKMSQIAKAASDPEVSEVLLPGITYFVHNMSESQKLAVDQLVNSVCHALGEVGVRSVQGEYKAEEAVPPSLAVLGPLKSLDFPTFLKHAQQLPAQLLMVLLVLKGQKTNATKQQPVSLSLRKARRIKAAAEKYMCSSTSSEQQTQLKPGQQVIDTDKFKKLLQEADPSSCSVVDSNLSQQTRDKYTGPDAALTIDTAAEVLATASVATREQFSSKFSEAAAGDQSSIAFADMKKCLPAIHRLKQQDDSVIRALLRSETSEMSLTKGVPLLRRFAAAYMENPKYAANLQLPVVLPVAPEALSPPVGASRKAN